MTKTVLGIDYGDVRTGLALNAGVFAYGAGCIRRDGFKKTAAAVAEFAAQKKADLIVIGNPINMDGTEGQRSQKCRAFGELLQELTGLPFELFDERLTTVRAHDILSEINVRGKKRKGAVDELSATLILQGYIDKNKEAFR